MTEENNEKTPGPNQRLNRISKKSRNGFNTTFGAKHSYT